MFFNKLFRHDSQNASKAVYAEFADKWDRSIQKPVIRSSICTGEKVAGFKNLNTGKFEDIMLIRDDRDMDRFLRLYGGSPQEVTTEY